MPDLQSALKRVAPMIKLVARTPDKNKAEIVDWRRGGRVWRCDKSFTPAPNKKLAPSSVPDRDTAPGGLPPRVRDSSKLFNKTAQVFTLRPSSPDKNKNLRGWYEPDRRIVK